MHITLLAAILAFSAPASLAEIAGTVVRTNFGQRTSVMSSVTVTSAGKAGAQIGTQCSPNATQWYTLTPLVLIDAVGAKGNATPAGRPDWDLIPVECRTDPAYVRAVSIGGGSGSTNVTLSNIAIEVL